MGFKRPFDDAEFQELPFKHLRQLEHSNKLTSFAEIVPCNDAPQKPDISGGDEGGFHKSQRGEGFEYDSVTKVSIMADKEFETSAPLSWVTSSTSEDDAGSGAAAYSSLSPEYFESDFPRRTLVQFEDFYSSFLDRSPRKQVPVGPNYQANVPVWGLQKIKNKLDRLDTFNPHISSSHLLGSDHIFCCDDGEKLMGTSIIPMPNSELSAHNPDMVGDGRTDCSCLDRGSVRCVRQHVMEVREKLRKTLGQEKFVDLGFCDMGEEVAHKWSEKEEQVFHEVVLSNPTSLRKNFWEHLSVMFPSRTKRELVSYYFNVFMLQRRAAQNRCNLLDIDSDDDEWHGSNVDSYNVVVTEEDEDSVIESLVDQDYQVDHEEDSSEDDDDDPDSDGDGDVGVGRGDGTVEDGIGGHGRDHMSEANIGKSHNGCRFVPVVHHADKIFGSVGEDFDIQDDSCMSFECQYNMPDSSDPVEAGAAIQESGVESNHSKSLHGDSDGSTNGVDPGYLFDPCDAKVWDARYSAGLDLLPTCSMIEEIFGLGSWNNK